MLESMIGKLCNKKASESLVSPEYAQLLERIKIDILQTQLKAATSVTTKLTMLYWRIGKHLSKQINVEQWGSKVEERLTEDLKSLFPGIAGFSLRNVRYMKMFAQAYVDINLATAVAKLPWGHNIALLERLSDDNQRLWYAQQTIENGWSR